MLRRKNLSLNMFPSKFDDLEQKRKKTTLTMFLCHGNKRPAFVVQFLDIKAKKKSSNVIALACMLPIIATCKLPLLNLYHNLASLRFLGASAPTAPISGAGTYISVEGLEI